MQTWQGLNFRRESFDIFPTPGLRNFGSVTKPWTAQTVQILGQLKHKQKIGCDKTAGNNHKTQKQHKTMCDKTLDSTNCTNTRTTKQNKRLCLTKTRTAKTQNKNTTQDNVAKLSKTHTVLRTLTCSAQTSVDG